MKNQTKQTKDKSDDFRSCRFTEQTWKKGDQILSEINTAFAGKRRINWDKLLDLALNLVDDEHKKQLRSRGRSERERLQIWKQIYIHNMGPITEDGFYGFVMSDDFPTFKKKYKRDYDNVA